MFDAALRPAIAPLLQAAGRRLAAAGVTANQVTIAGFLIGVGAAAAIAFEAYLAGLLFLLLSRLADGLDGAVARQRGSTDLGGYLDIVLDFAFYGAIPLGFVLADPAANAVAGAVLLFAFYANGASFLAYAVFAEKLGLKSTSHGPKALHFTGGLAEATETIAAFALFCLFPAWFAPLAYAFAALTAITTASRILLAARMF